jgi:hypothetical protein
MSRPQVTGLIVLALSVATVPSSAAAQAAFAPERALAGFQYMYIEVPSPI